MHQRGAAHRRHLFRSAPSPAFVPLYALVRLAPAALMALSCKLHERSEEQQCTMHFKCYRRGCILDSERIITSSRIIIVSC
jgi:hypothetical protein